MNASPLMEAVFAAVPREEWADDCPGSFEPWRALRANATFMDGMPLVQNAVPAPSPVYATEPANRVRAVEADARCEAMWADPMWHVRGCRAPIAERHGYVSVKKAEQAIKRWKRRLKNRGEA